MGCRAPHWALGAIFDSAVALDGRERSVAAAVLQVGAESAGVVTASFGPVAAHSGVSGSALNRMKHKTAGSPVLSWGRGVVSVILANLPNCPLRAEVPTLGAHFGHPLRAEVPTLGSGTVGATHGGVTIDPSGTPYPQGEGSRARDLLPSPAGPAAEGQPIDADVLSRWGVLMQAGAAPLTMAASEALSLAWAEFGRDVVRLALAELEDWSNQRHGAKPFPAWLGDRCRRIRIRQTADEVGVAVKVAAPSERLRALLDACAAKVRLGSLTPHQQAAVVELVEGESDAVLVTLATRIDATPSVSNPAGLLASMLVEVREEVRRAEAQRAVAERQAAESEARIRAIREHEERMARDPEYRAKRAADAARLREAVEAL